MARERAARPRAPPFMKPPGYTCHRPEATLLYQLVERYYPQLVAAREAAGRPLPQHVQDEFAKYLKFGRLSANAGARRRVPHDLGLCSQARLTRAGGATGALPGGRGPACRAEGVLVTDDASAGAGAEERRGAVRWVFAACGDWRGPEALTERSLRAMAGGAAGWFKIPIRSADGSADVRRFDDSHSTQQLERPR